MEIHRKHLVHFNEAGHAHALTFSCYRRLPLLGHEQTRRWFLESLRAACERHAFDLSAFVLMPEHVHLLVVPQAEVYDIAKFLQTLKRPVAYRANAWLRVHDPEVCSRLTETGTEEGRFHFWQRGGGFDRNIYKEAYFLLTIEYLHNNPVRRGLVQEPSEWKWSSYAWHQRGCNGSVFDGFDEG